MVFPKEFFENVYFEKIQQPTKSMQNFPACKEFKADGNGNSFLRNLEFILQKYILSVPILREVAPLPNLSACF